MKKHEVLKNGAGYISRRGAVRPLTKNGLDFSVQHGRGLLGDDGLILYRNTRTQSNIAVYSRPSKSQLDTIRLIRQKINFTISYGKVKEGEGVDVDVFMTILNKHFRQATPNPKPIE